MTLEIGKGEFVTLIGPSGCGKSTLLKLISGLTAPSSGTIRVDGLTPKNAREIVSFIFQDPNAIALAHGGAKRLFGIGTGGCWQRSAVQTRGRIIGAGWSRFRLGSVSPGAFRRDEDAVSIARALATNPRLLLMDEPFAALDEMTRDRLNEELLRLRAEQKWTAVFVTHSVSEAVFLSTRIIVLAPNPGRIMRSSRLTQILYELLRCGLRRSLIKLLRRSRDPCARRWRREGAAGLSGKCVGRICPFFW